MHDDGFKLVKSKKKSRRTSKETKDLSQDKGSGILSSSISKETALRRIESAKQEILSSDFYLSVLVALRQGLEVLGGPIVKHIVCYGIGNFAECMVARYQFGLLLSLKEHFQAKILIHDPVFHGIECELVGLLDCELILENEEGKRRITPGETTLVFLPHCPKQLTNNFLWSNWDLGLKDCVIFGNSFSKLVETQPRRILANTAAYILHIFPYVEEIGIVNSFKYTDIFNDTSLHIFPEKKLLPIAQDLWEYRDEPTYDKEDLELVTKSLAPSLSGLGCPRVAC